MDLTSGTLEHAPLPPTRPHNVHAVRRDDPPVECPFLHLRDPTYANLATAGPPHASTARAASSAAAAVYAPACLAPAATEHAR